MGCCGGEEEKTPEEVEMNGNEGGDPKAGKYGEPLKYDPTFNGPIKNRSCTDVICCLLFIVFIAASVIVAFFAFTAGNPMILIHPTDSYGQVCGAGQYRNKPVLFFFDLTVCAKLGPGVVMQGCPTPQICMHECPKERTTVLEIVAKEKLEGKPSSLRNKLVCQYGVDPINDSPYKEMDAWDLIEKDFCAPYTIESKPFLGRCIPTFIADALNALSQVVNKTMEGEGLSPESQEAIEISGYKLESKNGTEVTGADMAEASKYLAQFYSAVEIGKSALADVIASWWMIVIALVISAILALIWLLLMRWIAGIMVWVSIGLFVVLFGFLTYYCFNKYVQMKDLPEASGNYYFTTNLSYYLTLKDTWLAFGIIVAIILGITLLLVIFLRSRILIAISLIKEASKAIGYMMSCLAFPLLPFVLHIAVLGYFLCVAVYLASSQRMAASAAKNDSVTMEWEFQPCNLDVSNITAKIRETINNDSKLGNASAYVDDACKFLKYEVYGYVDWLQAYNLFIFFWLFNFVDALCQMTLAGAFASYYWAWEKPKDLPTFPVCGSLWRCFRYHLGSLAFGSLIIAIVQMIRVVLEYVDQKLKKSENQVAKFFMKVLKCFFWCLEKFLKFINKNAYIMVAVYGKNFCVSAKNAFFLLMRNVVRVVVVDRMTAFCLFIAKLVVVGGTILLSHWFFEGGIPRTEQFVPTLNYHFVPVVIIGVMSYVIASAFFSVYEMGVDTLFLCFLEDLERHDGSAEKPYYMSKDLMEILDKENKVPKDKSES